MSPFLDCPSCGNRVPESSKFCSQCGEPLVSRPRRADLFIRKNELPETTKDMNNTGYQFSRAQLSDQAISSYERAIRLDPAFRRAYWNLALCIDHVGEYDTAISVTTKGLELPQSEPRHTANLLNVRAFAFGRLKRYEEAISDLNKAIELDPEGIEHLFSRARVNAYRGEIEEAIRDTDAVLATNPEHVGDVTIKVRVGRLRSRNKSYFAAMTTTAICRAIMRANITVDRPHSAFPRDSPRRRYFAACCLISIILNSFCHPRRGFRFQTSSCRRRCSARFASSPRPCRWRRLAWGRSS